MLAHRPFVLLLVPAAATLALTACTGQAAPQSSPSASTSTAPPTSAGTSPSSPPDSSSAPGTSPTAEDADTGAAATASLARYLTDNGYTDVVAGPNKVTYTVEKDTYVASVRCAGGLRHPVGWTGICGGVAKGEPPFVIPARVVGGPRAESYAMSQDDAAYCGNDETPTWAKRVLKKASSEYCYLRQDEDG